MPAAMGPPVDIKVWTRDNPPNSLPKCLLPKNRPIRTQVIELLDNEHPKRKAKKVESQEVV